MIIATFLDPRFKNKIFESSNDDGSDLGTYTGTEMLLRMIVDTLESIETKRKLLETGEDK